MRTSAEARSSGRSFGRVFAASAWLSLGIAGVACGGSSADRVGPSHEADAPAPSGGEPSASPTDLSLSAATSSQRTAISGPAATSEAPTTGETTTTGETGATLAELTTDPEAPASGGGDAPADAETGERAQARLCSRPYTLSGTPGKGASRGEKSPAAYADANERLRRGFDVAVDGGARQRWTPKEGIEVDGLDPSERHTVMISAADGKRIHKLVLDFRARGGHDLCLGFNDFYNTWQLRKLRSGERCGPCVTREGAS